jgi:putative hydrolase of the HAD superfamily
MIKAVCFDFDGTLAQFTGNFQTWLLQGAKDLKIPPQLHEPFATALGSYSRSLANSFEMTKQALLAVGLEPPKNLEQFCQESTARYASDIHLLGGAERLLQKLYQKNVPLALITNGPADMQLASIAKINIQSYFKAMLISGELGIRKPDARIFQLACERLEVAPNNCLMVGDNLEADIAGAKSIGMQAVWMSEEKRSDIVAFADLQGLEAWLLSNL